MSDIGISYSEDRGCGRPAKYPLRRLAIGDTVFFPGIVANTICKRTWMYKPMKFRCKTVVKAGVMGARVWRIS